MFLEQNNAFYNYQLGFRNNYSTNHALIEITEQIGRKCLWQKLFHLRSLLCSTKSIWYSKPWNPFYQNWTITELKELHINGLSHFSVKECNILWSKKMNNL